MDGSTARTAFSPALGFWCHHAELALENWKTGCGGGGGGGDDGQHRFQVEMASQAAMSRYLDQRSKSERLPETNESEGIAFSQDLDRQDPCDNVTDCDVTAAAATTSRDEAANNSRRQSSSSLLPVASSSASSSSSTPRRRRKRIINGEQRIAANVRERKRMTHMNAAFDRLRQRMPPTTFERRRSRIEILKSAVSYIRLLTGILETL